MFLPICFHGIMGLLCKVGLAELVEFPPFSRTPEGVSEDLLGGQSGRGFGNNIQGFHLCGGHLSVDGLIIFLRCILVVYCRC